MADDLDESGRHYRPFLRLNLWRDLSGRDQARFNDVTLNTERGGTGLQFGIGLSVAFAADVQVYVTADYLTDVDGLRRHCQDGV